MHGLTDKPTQPIASQFVTSCDGFSNLPHIEIVKQKGRQSYLNLYLKNRSKKSLYAKVNDFVYKNRTISHFFNDHSLSCMHEQIKGMT